VAIRDDQGELYIAESTAKDSYWPTNGIQRTPYVRCVFVFDLHPVLILTHRRFKQWIQQAKDASFNVVHAPLSDENRAKFNATAALEFFGQGNVVS